MELTTIFSWTFVYDFLSGPMVWIAGVVFILGTAFQAASIFSLTQEQTIPKLSTGPGNIIKPAPAPGPSCSRLLWLKLSIAGISPFIVAVTVVFHLILLVMPFFVLGHNILFENAFGISPVSLPEPLCDKLTLVVIGCTAVFLFRRLVWERVRMITSFGDYLFLFLAAVPFITGYLAYHQILMDYKIVICLHILFGELMLMAIPFTKFVHMIYFVVVRFYAVSEYTLGKGDRQW